MASIKCGSENINKENKDQLISEEKCRKKTPKKFKQNANKNEDTQINGQLTKTTTANRRAAGSNWQQAATVAKAVAATVVAAVAATLTTQDEQIAANANVEPVTKKSRRRKRNKWGNKHVAMDCEMVGIGERGEKDMLARVSIVNRHGNVLLDKYVKPRDTVVDYRTSVSGIRPADIERGEEFDTVQDQVINLLQDRVLVGHGLRKDLTVLQIKHPFVNTRDTSCYKPLARLVGNGRTPSLKRLAHCLLGAQIQTGEHDSVEDARAAMNIYNSCCDEWEKYIQRKAR